MLSPHRRSPSIVTTILPLIAIVALVLGQLASTASAAPQRAGDAPQVGDCHQLGFKAQAGLSDPRTAVSCTKTHTTRTFKVLDVPAGTKMDDIEALGTLVTEQCTPAFRRAVGGNTAARLLTAYSYVWFAPTKAEIDAGARFLRCDLDLLGFKRTVALPAARSPQIGTSGPRDVEARCYTAKSSDYRVVSCSQRHAYRAAGTVKLAGKKYPSERARQKIFARQCPKYTGRQSYVVFPPSKEAFRAGFRFAICAAVTER